MTVFVVGAGTPGQPMTPRVLGALRRARIVWARPGRFEALERWIGGAELLPWGGEVSEIAAEVAGRATPGDVAVVVGDGGRQHSRGLLDALQAAGLTVRLVPGPEAGDLFSGERVPREETRAWVAARPLLGWRVLVTRPAHQAEGLARLLEARGAEAVRFPVIRIVPPSDPRPLERAVEALSSYDWLLFTSANGVTAFRDRLRESGGDGRNLAGIRVAAIGPATAETLLTVGIRADVVPDEFVAESLLKALAAHGPWQDARVLLPRAREARDALPRGIESLGATVDVVEAYRTVPVPATNAVALREELERGQVDLVTFTASSAVRAFWSAVGTLGRARAVAIGPITAGTARELGIEPARVAAEYTAEGLVDACAALVRDESG